MRKRAFAVLMILYLAAIFVGCGKEKEQFIPTTVEYSNLLDDSVREELAAVMTDAKISQIRQQVFFDHVEQFNSAVSTDGLAADFVQAELPKADYDPYMMQDEWLKKYPDFLGYNCRITSFGLFGDMLEISGAAAIKEDNLIFDLSALQEDSSILIEEGDLKRFKALFSSIPTENTTKINRLVKTVQQNWRERGITFKKQNKVSLITVFFHDIWEGDGELFVGHVGVLFPQTDGTLYFLEKIAFQEPYQVIKLKHRAELKHYLMNKYAVDFGQSTPEPFIMENDCLMEIK